MEGCSRGVWGVVRERWRVRPPRAPFQRFQGLGVKGGLSGITYLGVPGSKERTAVVSWEGPELGLPRRFRDCERGLGWVCVGSRVGGTHLAWASSRLLSVMVIICCRMSPMSCFLGLRPPLPHRGLRHREVRQGPMCIPHPPIQGPPGPRLEGAAPAAARP